LSTNGYSRTSDGFTNEKREHGRPTVETIRCGVRLKGYKSEDFKSPLGNVRNVDNLDLSQSWLSFLGFSDQAIHNKREIFSDDRYYDVIFRKRVAKHGFDYDFKLLDPAVREDAEDQAPSQYMLLTAYLMYDR
jgi:hypothetical protein